jgi:Holliday junction resolvase-like predicted endonuclease
VALRLAAGGWHILARNVRLGRLELDIVALDRAPPITDRAHPGGSDVGTRGGPTRGSRGRLVIVEVRSSSGPGFGSPEESVDHAKVSRLYEAAWRLARAGQLPDGQRLPDLPWRVDLVSVVRAAPGRPWVVNRHLRGVTPPSRRG